MYCGISLIPGLFRWSDLHGSFVKPRPAGSSWTPTGLTVETMTDFILGGSEITADGDCSHEIKRRLLLGRNVMTNLDSTLKSRDITLPTKVGLQGYGFSSSLVWMWELDYKESWAPKNWCFWTVVLEKAESPLDCKEWMWRKEEKSLSLLPRKWGKKYICILHTHSSSG